MAKGILYGFTGQLWAFHQGVILNFSVLAEIPAGCSYKGNPSQHQVGRVTIQLNPAESQNHEKW